MALFLISNVFASIECNVKDIDNTGSNVIYCLYKSTKAETLSPILKTSNGLTATLLTAPKAIAANSSYRFDIEIDIANSTQGNHSIIISQGTDIKTINFNIFKMDENITYDVNYLDNYAELTLNIPNVDIRNKVAIIKLAQNINGYYLEPNSINTILLRNNINTIKLKLYYVNPESESLKLKLMTSDGEKYIEIPLYKQNIPYTSNSINTPLFTLTSTKTAIVLDIVLFIIAVVLFTMFISRLGKIIIKK